MSMASSVHIMQVTEFDAEPMPNMEEIINKMSGRKYFTKVDLSMVGWLVVLGLNGPLRQYFSLHRAVSQREGERKEK